MDSRTPVIDLTVRPYAAICLIQARYDRHPGIVGYGTGFLVSTNRVATAAHVIWNDLDGLEAQKRLPDAIDIFLGKGLLAGNPHLMWTLVPSDPRKIVHPNYRSPGDGFDIGKLTIPRDMVAPLPVIGLANDLAPGDAVTIGGYPVDLVPFGHYEGTGPLVTRASPVFLHQVDTGIGQSGAPVRVFRNGRWSVIGVHLADAQQPGPNGAPAKRALALTGEHLSWLLAS